jgi:hypothetical protein
MWKMNSGHVLNFILCCASKFEKNRGWKRHVKEVVDYERKTETGRKGNVLVYRRE